VPPVRVRDSCGMIEPLDPSIGADHAPRLGPIRFCECW
jgi:hypothetical protein